MRRRKKIDLYIVIFLFIVTVGYFIFTNISADSKGYTGYSEALKIYKTNDYEQAFVAFGKIPRNSNRKQAALFRQARCATALDKKELAVKKYKKVMHSNSKTAIVPISHYNMAVLLYELKDRSAKKHFKQIIKKYPSSDYAIASNYYLGMIAVQHPPKRPKKIAKSQERALLYFKEYIQRAPDGRFSVNSINEIKKLDVRLTNYDNLLIAKSYYLNGEYDNAKEFLNKTTLSESWTDFAKNEYKLGNKQRANEYAEQGFKDFLSTAEPKDVHEVIDGYISSFPTRKEGIQKLLALNLKSTGADYVAYLNCSEVVDKGV